jgi:hypothetical protein
MLCLILLPQFAWAELTKQDLQEINALILQSEERMKEYVDIKIARLETKIEEMDKRIHTRIDGMERELTILEWVIGLLGAGFLAALALPQFLERKTLKEQIDQLIRDRREDRIRIEELERKFLERR